MLTLKVLPNKIFDLLRWCLTKFVASLIVKNGLSINQSILMDSSILQIKPETLINTKMTSHFMMVGTYYVGRSPF